MSVLIRDMEMPTNCDVCFMRDACEYSMPLGKRLTECPLVEIPPHGRLIDADVAAKQGWTISRTYSASPTEMVYEVKKMTDEVLPTIIEAEESK